MLTSEEIPRLAAFMAETLRAPDIRIANVAPVQGDVSRETLRFDAVTPERRHCLILRRDPPGRPAETERRIEFAALRSFHDSCVPVPRPIALVEDGSVLGRPFMVMQRIDNAIAPALFLPDAFGEHRESLGRSFFSILGSIHATDPQTSDLASVATAPAPRTCWRQELERWESAIETDALEPQPIALAAIRRLRRNPPPPPQSLAIVHGDYRNGNFLTDGKGSISAILDWELAHIGDPHEDLAWALDPLWSARTANGASRLAAGMLEFDEAIAIWSRASRRIFDPEAFRWWSLLAGVKGIAVALSCSRRFSEMDKPDPGLAFTGLHSLIRHNKIIADRLAGARRGAIT